MSRGDSAIRLLKVIMYLETHPEGLTAREIHNKLREDSIEISDRTVYRDLEVISSAHFPLYSESYGDDLNGDKRWKFRRTTALSDKVHFENHEIFALFLARESLKSLKGSPLIDDILTMTKKLEQALGTGVEKELKNLSEYVSYKATATWQTGISQEILDTIYQACWDKTILEIEYKSKSGEFNDQIAKRRLGPETLYFAQGGAYLIAKDLKDQKIKSYSLNRVFSANYTNEEYKSSKFNLEEFIGDNFGMLSAGDVQDVSIFISDPLSSFVSERRWHNSQEIIRKDKGIEFKLRVKINDELARWVLGLGPSAVVHEPRMLREMVQNLANEISQNYKLKKSA